MTLTESQLKKWLEPPTDKEVQEYMNASKNALQKEKEKRRKAQMNSLYAMGKKHGGSKTKKSTKKKPAKKSTGGAKRPVGRPPKKTSKTSRK